MTLTQDIVTDGAIGVGIAQTPEALSTIHDPECAAAVWHRQPLQAFQEWIDALDPEVLPRARTILRSASVRKAVEEICETSGTPAGPHRDRLVDDIAALSDIFSKQMDVTWLRLRLDVVTTNACRKFHIDAVTARLVCTYRGAGTQYGTSTDGADPSRVFTVPTCAPIMLRGTLWPEKPKSGLLHRSPPIEGTGEARLLLVLDPIFDPAEETAGEILH